MKNNLVSCIICKKELTVNGFKLHYFNSHTKKGKISQNKHATKGGKSFKKNKIRDREQYMANPSLCEYCLEPLPYEKKSNRFCNSSCSAKNNNSIREYKDETRTKIKESIKSNYVPYCIIKFKTCLYCNNSFIYSKDNPNVLNSHCSYNCYSKNRSKIARNRKIIYGRSKDEVKLFELCKKYFNNVQNNIKIEGWEADIFIPSYNIAIEWNGAWHYKQLNFKGDSLDQRIARDFKKIEKFESLGMYIKIYEDRHWKPFDAFIDILTFVNKNRKNKY